jgi:S-(hydroxymethyl)glutathione dehydrogenase/alcohol dehydrogenase
MPCGTCRHCVRDRDDLCEPFFTLNRLKGVLYDGTSRLRRSDGSTLAMYSMAGLADYAVVPASDVFPMPEGIDPDAASILGCAVFTAYGAVRHAPTSASATAWRWSRSAASAPTWSRWRARSGRGR